MVYVAEVGETHLRSGKKNARLRVIFDNGTEGNNLLRSLARELYKDPNGRRVTTTDMGPLFESKPQPGDTATGMVYVVKSLSADPEISHARRPIAQDRLYIGEDGDPHPERER